MKRKIFFRSFILFFIINFVATLLVLLLLNNQPFIYQLAGITVAVMLSCILIITFLKRANKNAPDKQEH